jgi:hypothetical protein
MIDPNSHVKTADTLVRGEGGSWPFSVIRRQLSQAKRTRGLRRFAATLLIGIEIVVIAAVIAALVLI